VARLCWHALVSGRVQGVAYRQHTDEQAQRLDLDGWVRNLDDGRVEVLFEGEAEAVQALATWLEQGPSAAEVAEVTLSEMPLQGLAGFIVLR
jgi:acylphosphatase